MAAQDPARRLERTRVSARRRSLFEGIAEGSQVYFTHSYAAPVTNDAIAVTTHGMPFASASSAARCSACSFIRKNRATSGSSVLKNFLNAV